MRGKLVFIGLLLMSEAIHAQVNRYFVYFKDKIGTPYSISQPTQFLSARSIARREKQNIAITEADLPVNPAYVADVKATGAKTFFTSRWWNGVLIEATPITLPSITALP
jgi:serine protease AprX